MCFSFGQILDKFLILFSVRSLTRPVFGHLLDYIAHTKKQHNMATPSMTVELAGFQHRDGVPHQGPGLCMSKDTVFGQLCF